MDRFAFFLPTRKGSERVKNKNTRPFAGFQGGLLQLKLQQLLQVKEISIVLSTNDPESIKVAKQFEEPRIIIEERPDELALASTPLQDLINYVPKATCAQHIIWTHATSPFIGENLYKSAIKQYEKGLQQGYDSLMSVTKIQDFIWDGTQNTTINYDRHSIKWPRTQDLKPLYAINSGFFINSRANYLDLADRIGQKPYLMELVAQQALDIDWEEDFKTAEQLYESIQPV